jgi:hypothetical protein
VDLKGLKVVVGVFGVHVVVLLVSVIGGRKAAKRPGSGPTDVSDAFAFEMTFLSPL